MKAQQTLTRILTLAFAAAVLAYAPHARAQANSNPPERLTYQGFLVDANGVALANTAPKNYDVIFRIYDHQSSGNLKWAEQQTVTVDKGYFSVLLGEGSQVGSEPRPTLSTVFTGADASDRFVAVTVKGMGGGGTDLNILPRLRLLTAPYAFMSRNASALVSPNGSTLATAGNGALTIAGTVTGTSFTGSGANLTGLTAGQIPSLDASKVTTGTLADARIPSLDASKVTTGTLADARIPSLDASKITTGTLNNARTTATSANTANAIVARDGSGNFTAGQVTANSFKINNTQTLVLYDISRFKMALNTTTTPIAGVSQTVYTGEAGGRQSSVPSNWYLSTSTSWGKLAYVCTYTVPAGELWEITYECNALWSTDDNANLVWTVNDVLTDDTTWNLTGWAHNGSSVWFGRTFVFTNGTYTLRVKGAITGGSGTDYISFPHENPAQCVVKKYKVN